MSKKDIENKKIKEALEKLLENTYSGEARGDLRKINREMGLQPNHASVKMAERKLEECGKPAGIGFTTQRKKKKKKKGVQRNLILGNFVRGDDLTSLSAFTGNYEAPKPARIGKDLIKKFGRIEKILMNSGFKSS